MHEIFSIDSFLFHQLILTPRNPHFQRKPTPKLPRRLRFSRKASSKYISEVNFRKSKSNQDTKRNRRLNDFHGVNTSSICIAKYLQIVPQATLKTIFKILINIFGKIEKSNANNGIRNEELSLHSRLASYNPFYFFFFSFLHNFQAAPLSPKQQSTKFESEFSSYLPPCPTFSAVMNKNTKFFKSYWERIGLVFITVLQKFSPHSRLYSHTENLFRLTPTSPRRAAKKSSFLS